MTREYYAKSIEETLKDLASNMEMGLTEHEAKKRLDQYGKNVIAITEQSGIFSLILAQFQSVLIYVLLIAVGITFFIGEYIDAGFILMVVVLNATLGVIQEYKAHRAIDALKKMSSPKALVRREGRVYEVDSEDLVAGDIILLDAGRIIPADCRLIEAVQLYIDESVLTGESVPVVKDATKVLNDTPLTVWDRVTMAYTSTVVTAWRGVWIVIKTANDTEIWSIAKSLTAKEPKTPLEIRVDALGKTIGKIVVVICILLLLIAYLQGRDLEDMFLIAVSLAVASIPEWLAAIITIVLSIGVKNMSEKNAIIRKLPAVETLWSVNVVCSDKTGTLTQNRMTVTYFSLDPWTYSSLTEEYTGSREELHLLAKALVLSSDATLDHGIKTGDPTEIALLEFADAVWLDRASLKRNTERVKENPFDSERKCMSTLVHEWETYTIYAKWAMNHIIEISTHIRLHGKVISFTQSLKDQCLHDMEQFSAEALRVLAVWYREAESDTAEKDMEEKLIFLGCVGMIDPPREEARISIEKAKGAGVTPIMITGDHKITAFAIAQSLGIAESIDQVLTGEELDTIFDSAVKRKQFEQHITQYRVFARVSPRHKVLIVQALQKWGNIVSMTGDGVNDAPSLNAADIGVAMGITGTDVSKWASDMILTDDNFATIVSAIEAGRNIYNNIKKSILFLLTGNLWEVITMVVALSIWWETPLLATQLLWINLITDSLPAIALGMDTNDPDIMREPPRNPKLGFFSRSTFLSIFSYGWLIGGITLMAFWIGYAMHGYTPYSSNVPMYVLDFARTLWFITLIIAQMFFAFSIRSRERTLFSLGIFSNPYLIMAWGVALWLQISILAFSFTRDLFHLTPLSLVWWGICIGLGIIPAFLNEMRKIIFHSKER